MKLLPVTFLCTFQCRRHRFGCGEGVDLRERTFSCLAHGLDPETVAAQFTQALNFKCVTRPSIDRHKPGTENTSDYPEEHQTLMEGKGHEGRECVCLCVFVCTSGSCPPSAGCMWCLCQGLDSCCCRPSAVLNSEVLRCHTPVSGGSGAVAWFWAGDSAQMNLHQLHSLPSPAHYTHTH